MAARWYPDFRWPEQRLVIEADGAAWHDNQLAREDDAERQALLKAAGERVLRVHLGASGGRAHGDAPPHSRGGRSQRLSPELFSLRLNNSRVGAPSG